MVAAGAESACEPGRRSAVSHLGFGRAKERAASTKISSQMLPHAVFYPRITRPELWERLWREDFENRPENT